MAEGKVNSKPEPIRVPIAFREVALQSAGTVQVTVPSTANPAPVSVASVSDMSSQAPPFQYFTVRLLAVPFGT